ncbi:presenilin-B-like [Oppia nitens]|uniref:presenilin-B-like n=1 Tax=Oppia nitens TaxID=1686743 RepID=UPI0023DA92E1|nr:presenilin-B-like [Oppia nitens]
MSIWDIYAVLHTTGPLNKIFQNVEQNNRNLPPIIYTTAVWLEASDGSDDNSNLELGLGDFIFFSVLVGKSFASGDVLMAIICFISVLVGLAITLFILLIKNFPLPALPISITMGLLAHFTAKYFIIPFNDSLQNKLIFI